MIKSIYIENFKSIERQTIHFDELSMLIGENASGKTNLIHAIAFLKRVVLGPNIETAFGSFAALPSELLNKRSRTNQIKIILTLVNGDEREYVLSYAFHLDDTETTKVLSIAYEKFEVISEDRQEVIIERKKDSVVFKGALSETDLKIEGGVAVVSLLDHESIQKVKSLLQNIYISEADISASGSRQTLEEKVILALARLKKKKEEFEQFEKIVKKLIPSLSSLVDMSKTLSQVVTKYNEYQFLFSEKNMEGNLSMKAGSHGDLRTYFILAMALFAPEHSTIIIEEVENGIHTKRAKDLLDFLEKIAYQKNKQLIMSSHNPRLIGKVPYEKLIVVERSADGGESIYRKLKQGSNVHALEEFLERGGNVTELAR